MTSADVSQPSRLGRASRRSPGPSTSAGARRPARRRAGPADQDAMLVERSRQPGIRLHRSSVTAVDLVPDLQATRQATLPRSHAHRPDSSPEREPDPMVPDELHRRDSGFGTRAATTWIPRLRCFEATAVAAMDGVSDWWVDQSLAAAGQTAALPGPWCQCPVSSCWMRRRTWSDRGESQPRYMERVEHPHHAGRPGAQRGRSVGQLVSHSCPATVVGVSMTPTAQCSQSRPALRNGHARLGSRPRRRQPCRCRRIRLRPANGRAAPASGRAPGTTASRRPERRR